MVDSLDPFSLFYFLKIGNRAFPVEAMLTRENKEMVREDAVPTEVARTCRVYVYMCSVGLFLLHLLHLLRLHI